MTVPPCFGVPLLHVFGSDVQAAKAPVPGWNCVPLPPPDVEVPVGGALVAPPLVVLLLCGWRAAAAAARTRGERERERGDAGDQRLTRLDLHL